MAIGEATRLAPWRAGNSAKSSRARPEQGRSGLQLALGCGETGDGNGRGGRRPC